MALLVVPKNPQQGFTLIELMVVMSIIGILAAVIFVSFDDGRKQSRDKVRMAELKELQLAVELYKAQNDEYPAQGCGTVGTQWAGKGSHPSWGASCDVYIVGLAPDFIAALPSDPNQEDQNGRGFIYRTNSTRSSYKILVHESVESQLVTSVSDEFSRCPANYSVSHCGATPQSTVYGVYSAGAENW